MLRIAFAACLSLAATVSASDQIPANAPQNVALVGGAIHTVSGDVIENGVIVLKDGKIEAIFDNVAAWSPPAGTPTLDVAGQRIYPGLIDASSQIGLTEINSVRATLDLNEAGDINPNAQAHVSVNAGSELIPTVRANGILLSHVHPRGGLVSGQGAMMKLDGWTYEDMLLQAPTGIVMNWPNMLPRQAWWIDESIEEQIKERDERLRQIEELFDQAERYKLAREAAGLETNPTTQPATGPVDASEDSDVPPYDAKLEAMVPLFDGSLPLLISAGEASQIEAAVAFCQRRGLKMILVGGEDAGKVADLLVEANVPVILDGTHRMPRGRDADIDEAYTLPGELREAGVTFAISDDRAPSFSRNLPYHAAAAVPFGLSAEDALASITLWPAQILGVADRVGSLEVGKDATLFVADGDILEIPTHVTHAWIAGKPVDLSSKHTQLYEKYKQRYGQE